MEAQMEIPIEVVEAWEEYRKDWNLAARELLDVNLDKEQQAILSAVQNERMISVVSGTARGKDFVSAVAAFLFMYLTPEFMSNTNEGEYVIEANTKVALTAPTGRQVENIMYPEIVRLYNRAKRNFPILPGRLTGNDIRTEFEEWFLTGFKADEYNHEAWSGFHAVNTMFVVTEASGIAEDTFSAIEGNLQGNSKILIVFNPNNATGYAARSQRSGRWAKFRLNGLNAPNVTQKKIIIPGQVDYQWVKDKVETWCEPIYNQFDPGRGDFEFEGVKYRPNDTFRIKVLGMFPEVGEDVLIPLRWIEIANENWKRLERKQGTGTTKIGADIAGMGRDSSVFCPRQDNVVTKFEKIHSSGKADHMKLAGMLAHSLKNAGTEAYIDTIGEGAGVYSRLLEIDHAKDKAFSCKFSESAAGLKDITDQYEFLNMRAYLFWAVRDWLNPVNGFNPCLPPDDDFTEEATEIKWKFRSDGKIQIESKEDIKKRIGRSIDTFDALANTFYPNATKTTTNYNAIYNSFRI